MRSGRRTTTRTHVSHVSVPQGTGIQEKRRGVRLNSRVPVVIQWQNSSGVLVSRQVFTRIIGPYGCLAVLPENLPIGQQVTVVNTVTSESNSGIVVWNSNQQAEGWEIGIELTQPSMDFWGLEL